MFIYFVLPIRQGNPESPRKGVDAETGEKKLEKRLPHGYHGHVSKNSKQAKCERIEKDTEINLRPRQLFLVSLFCKLCIISKQKNTAK